jgi:hypothetical protein
MGKPVIAAAPATALKMRVEGMDCGACAVKIEKRQFRHRDADVQN